MWQGGGGAHYLSGHLMVTVVTSGSLSRYSVMNMKPTFSRIEVCSSIICILSALVILPVLSVVQVLFTMLAG